MLSDSDRQLTVKGVVSGGVETAGNASFLLLVINTAVVAGKEDYDLRYIFSRILAQVNSPNFIWYIHSLQSFAY